MKYKNKKKSFRLVLLFALFLLLIGGTSYYFFVIRTGNDATPTSSTVNYDPPTKEDADSVNDNKERIQKRDEALNDQSTNKDSHQMIAPIITYAGQYGSVVEVGGYINVLEDSGTCTVTFTQGKVVVTKTVTAVRDANSVDCPTISVDSSDFSPKGSYTVSLGYSSVKTTGVSEPREVVVK